MMHTPASSQRSFPAPAGEVARPQVVTEGASCPSPRPAGRWSAKGGSEGSSPLLPWASKGGTEQREAEGVSSSCIPRPTIRWSASGGTDGVSISPSGCHGLTRRATRAPSSPSAPNLSNAQDTPNPGCHHSTRSGAVVLLKTFKDTTARLRREWCHPVKTTTLPSLRGVAGETSPAQEFNSTLIRKWGR